MRSLRSLSLIALVAALAVPSVASAQMIPRSAQVDIMGGYYWFPSNVQNYNSSGIVGGRLGINFTQHVGFEATVGFVPTSTIHGNRTAQYIAPHFDLTLHLTPWRVVPYIALGAGFEYSAINEHYQEANAPAECDWKRDPYLSDAQIANSTQPTSEGGCGYSVGHLRYENEHINFIFDVGGGVKFLIFERGGLRIDARYILGHGPTTESDGGRQYGVPAAVGPEGNKELAWFNTFHHIELTGSVFFLIGGGPGKDTDGDGIPDRQDECPEGRAGGPARRAARRSARGRTRPARGRW